MRRTIRYEAFNGVIYEGTQQVDLEENKLVGTPRWTPERTLYGLRFSRHTADEIAKAMTEAHRTGWNNALAALMESTKISGGDNVNGESD